MLSNQDKEALRALAGRYMAAATQDRNGERVQLWRALNRGAMQRPMVVIEQLPWHELNGTGELDCTVQDPYWRGVELGLRRELYKWEHFPVDMVLDPFIVLPRAVSGVGYGITPDAERLAFDAVSDVISRHYENQLRTEEDIAKIKDMDINCDAALDAERLAVGQELFDGIAPVRLGGLDFNLGIWDQLSEWMGVQDIYFDLADRPEFIHKILRRATDATIAGIKRANELLLHNHNALTCHCSYVFDDETFPQPGTGKGAISQNCWTFGLAQLFTSVSPETTEEFELPYVTEMAQYFGNVYYGCCDRLDDRLDLVKRIPNVRKVSCSPWSKMEPFAERIGPKLVMSYKPNPAFLSGGMATDEIRSSLRAVVDCARSNNVNLEIILKDISTVGYDPGRIEGWEKIAMEIVQG